MMLIGSLEAAGNGTGQTQSTPCDQNVDPLLDSYNENVDANPGVVKGVVAGETVHLVIDGDTTCDFTEVTDSTGRVTDSERGAPDAPTVVNRLRDSRVDHRCRRSRRVTGRIR